MLISPRYSLCILAASVGAQVLVAQTVTFSPAASKVSQVADFERGFLTSGSPLLSVPGGVAVRGNLFVPADDAYARYAWAQLTNESGEYASSIDGKDNALIADLKVALSARAKLGFRIMALDTSLRAPTSRGAGSPKRDLISDVPLAQVQDAAFNGWVARNAGLRYYVPDWNNPSFLKAAAQLLEDIAGDIARQHLEDAVGFVDIGIYGNYGENETGGFVSWEKACTAASLGSCVGAAGLRLEPLTASAAHDYVDMHIAAFQGFQLIAQPYEAEIYGYAFSKAAGAFSDRHVPAFPIGWRADCLGTEQPDMPQQWCRRFIYPAAAQQSKGYPSLSGRWVRAPVMLEFNDPGEKTLLIPSDDLVTVHASTLDEINFNSSARAFLAEDARRTGYAIGLRTLTLPGTLHRGSSYSWTSEWTNDGAAPLYAGLGSWTVSWVLVPVSHPDQMISLRSRVNLAAVLPKQSLRQVDHIVIPQELLPGKYLIMVKVSDDKKYRRRPLTLQIEGRQPDGAYMLGEVEIQ